MAVLQLSKCIKAKLYKISPNGVANKTRAVSQPNRGKAESGMALNAAMRMRWEETPAIQLRICAYFCYSYSQQRFWEHVFPWIRTRTQRTRVHGTHCKSKWCVIQMNEQKHFPLTDGMTCTYEEEEGDDDVAILTLVSLRVHRDKWKAKAERSAVSKAICHFSFEIHSHTNRLTVDPAEYVYRIGPLYKAVERVDVDSSVPHSLWHLSRPQCATTTIDKHGLAFVPERRMCDSRTIVRSDFKVCQYLYAQQTKVRTDSILFVWSPFLRALFAPTSARSFIFFFQNCVFCLLFSFSFVFSTRTEYRK